MSSFFKAWAAYSGILLKLAPYALQGELAIPLFLYTMSLYDLLEKYAWDDVRSYHFQFHRKRVASGKSIYLPDEWRLLDSELIASRCFTYPAIRNTWNPGPGKSSSFPRRVSELPLRDNPFSDGQTQHGALPTKYTSLPERRLAHLPTYALNPTAGAHSTVAQSTSQGCRNWNYRECLALSCRYQHLCISCGNNHKAIAHTQGNTALLASGQTNRYNGR